MPGKKNVNSVESDFISNFALHRNTSNTDAAVADVAEEVDFTASPSATRNVIWLVATQASGTHKIKHSLYVRFPDAPAAIRDSWFLHTSGEFAAAGTFLRFTDLFAGIYRIVVTNETPGEEFDTYIATNQ